MRYKEFWKLLIIGLGCGIVLESGLAIAQFFSQGSIGGLFYFLGERTFTSSTPGIANMALNGGLVLRPYGTFPHPNVLAGYLVIGMTIISNIQFQIPNFKYPMLGFKKMRMLTLLLGTGALLVTFSRAAILVWIGICAYNLFIFLKRKILITVLIILACGFLFFLSPFRERFFITAADESVVYRLSLLHVAWNMIVSHISFGVGFGNFLSSIPLEPSFYSSIFVLQPVHNIFVLLFAETGLPGLLFFLWFTCTTVQKFKINSSTPIQSGSKLKVQVLGAVIVLGFFDHYFLTLQQGQLLLTLVFAICWAADQGESVKG